MKGYDADVHDFYIQNSLIDIRYLVVVKTGILPRFMYILPRGAEHPNICRNCQFTFHKVQRTEISFVNGYGALHLES
jgi:hypothetical protein